MRQRLGFAQALLGDPQLLLLDEPTTGLDPSAIRDFYDQLDLLRSQGVTLVISSHILAELQQRVDALAMLSNGRVCAQGTVQALRERSRMPLVFQLRAAPTWLQTLANDLPGQLAGADVGLHHPEPGLMELRCPREHKMRVLSWLASASLSDLQIHEPSLEDVYFGLREAP
jgi:Cu-processing system ATP-binding protein